MSLSVSSFPEAPPKLVQQPKLQVTPSLKSSGRFLGTLLRKRSVPFLKGIGHFAKTHVKGSIIRQRANVSLFRSLCKHHSSLSRSARRRPSSIVIDISEHFSARSSDVDGSSLNPTIDISLSPTISPAALSTPTVAKDISSISPIDPVKAPHQSSVLSLVRDSAHGAHETAVHHPAKEHEEVVSDSEPHDPQPPDSEITTPFPISPSLKTWSPTTVSAPSTEGRRRSLSASAGVKASAADTARRTLHRYKSETAIGMPRRFNTTMTPANDPSSSEGENSSRGKNTIPQPPATGSTHTSESTSNKQRHQRRETISKRARARSGPSSKSTGGSKALESPPLSAHSAQSTGSLLSANSRGDRPSTAPHLQPFSSSAHEQMNLLQAPPHFHPKTSDVAASPSLVVGPSPLDDASEHSLLPSSVDRGRWLRLAAVPHAESWDGKRQRRRPRTAPEAVLMTGW